MDLLNRLTIKNLKLNKKRTIVTIMGIILSVALISAVAGMFFLISFWFLPVHEQNSPEIHWPQASPGLKI